MLNSILAWAHKPGMSAAGLVGDRCTATRCPRCGAAAVPLGHARSALEWWRCNGCRFVWNDRIAAGWTDAPATPPADDTEHLVRA